MIQQVKLNVDMLIGDKDKKVKQAHKAGSIIDVEVDDEGTPKKLYWRKRFKDAVLDNCLEVIKPAKAAKKEEAK